MTDYRVVRNAVDTYGRPITPDSRKTATVTFDSKPDFIPNCPRCSRQMQDADQEFNEVYICIDCGIDLEIH